MKWQGVANQRARHPLYRADGTVTTGGVAQLVLAVSQARSLLILQNLSNGPLWFEHGAGGAKAVLSGAAGAGTNNSISSVTLTNAGFNFTLPPIVEFLGGGSGGNSSYLGSGQPNCPAPGDNGANGATLGRAAKAYATLSGGAINTIVMEDGGAGYVHTPYVFLRNSDLDPHGCSVPSVGVGMLLAAGSPPVILNGSCCWTDAVAVFGATTGQAFLARWMD